MRRTRRHRQNEARKVALAMLTAAPCGALFAAVSWSCFCAMEREPFSAAAHSAACAFGVIALSFTALALASLVTAVWALLARATA
jgi:hypothetical protein